MPGPIPLTPIMDLRLTFVEMLQLGRERKDAKMVHLCVSTLEYIKDAERWHYARDHDLFKWGHDQFATPEEFQKWVDAEMRK